MSYPTVSDLENRFGGDPGLAPGTPMTQPPFGMLLPMRTKRSRRKRKPARFSCFELAPLKGCTE